LVVRKRSFFFLVDAIAATAIRPAYNVAGEPGALADMRNRFPEIVDDETALARQSESAGQTVDSFVCVDTVRAP
jgi:hypothetical protein